MDGSRFDAWTRRTVGLAIGGGLTAILGVPAATIVKAKKKKKKRCLKFNLDCKPGGKRKCCKGLRCEDSAANPNPHCCRPKGAVCEVAEECCGDAVCDQAEGLDEQTRCCGASGGSCTKDTDCCDGFACDENIGECVP